MIIQGTCIMDSSSALNIFQTCIVSYKFGAECDIARRPLQAPSNHSIRHLTFPAEQRNQPQGILPLTIKVQWKICSVENMFFTTQNKFRFLS